MKPDDFEKQLEHQPLREIPAEWRDEILGAARAGHRLQLSTFGFQRSSWWRELLWPCPQAWAGLAAVWMLILAMNAASREPMAAAGSRTSLHLRELIAALQEQRRLFSELIETSAPDKPPGNAPQPRSDIPPVTIAV